jgi:pilus assembly protein FimV
VGKSITIGIVASALWLAACAAHAAGLGRLTVLSPLGQPLLAEVEVVALQPGEDDGLSARLASRDAFSAAGIEISPALLGVRVDIVRRNNRPVLRLTTKQPVNDPFLDLLIELQWPSGRLVREYTFLLDPPDYRNRPVIAAAPPATPPAPQSQATPQTQPVPQAEAPQAQPAPQSAPEPAAQAAPAPQAQAAPPAATEEKPSEEKPAASEEKPEGAEPKAAPPIEQQPIPATPAAEAKPPEKEAPAAAEAPKEEASQPATYEVKKGDTLGAIARANLQPGVTLNQMLIAIFRANEEAFIRGNVNLVRTGKILNIPSADAIGSVDREEANRLVKEQREQFIEYRSRLAAVPAPVEGGAQREAAGPIEPKPQATPPAAPSDQVRLSKSEPGKPAAPGSRAAREDDAAARERALQEAQSRTSDLEKNVADLQKLLELKNQQLAELEKKAGSKPAAPPPQPQAKAETPAAKPPAAEKPAAAPGAAPAQPAPPPAPKAEAPKPEAPKAEPPKPQPAAPAAQPPAQVAQAPAQPAAPPAQKKVEAPKPKAKPAPPPPEPSLLDEFLDNPLYLAALGAVVVLLLGYAAWSWRKKKAAHAKFQDSVLGAAAAGGGAAALHEPTANTATSVSQAPVSQAPAGMEAEEVDPIAEADVYMAYGRDAQAEEILKEALQKDANRTTVHAKLLEIYANRKDTRAFEQTALKLKNLTHGSGPEWEKAAALGRSIDPQNNVYGDVSAPPAAGGAAPAAAAAPTLDFDLGGSSQGGPAAPDISLDEPAKESTSTSVDLELGATNTLKIDKQAPDETLAAAEAPKSAGDALDFNLDLGGADEPKADAPAASKPAEEASGGLDFNLDLGGPGEKKPEAPQPPPQPVPAAPIDLGEISLDLGAPAEEPAAAPAASGDPKWQEVATKLDLAKAYEEMGDKDGARELLGEVMKDGDNAQKGQAEQLLAKLG